MPELSVDKDPLPETLKAVPSDPWAAVEVNSPEVEQTHTKLLECHVRYLEALPDVQGLQLEQGLRHLGQPLVGDPARGHGESSQVEETRGDVRQGAVADPLAEGDVKCVQTDATLGEVAHSDVADVVARAEVQRVQGRHFCHRLHPRVGNVRTKAEVEVSNIDPLGDVTKRKVSQLLTILQVESVKLDELGVLDVRIARQPGKVGHACVAELPAGPEREGVQVGEGASQQEQTRVGHPGAATEVETSQGGADGAKTSQAAVGHLLTEGEVD